MKEEKVPNREEKELTKITSENLEEFAKQLQFDTLASECTVEELCKNYGIERKDFMKLVASLKRKGHNINMKLTNATNLETGKLEQVTVIQNFGDIGLNDELTYKIIDNDENIKCMFLSDIRFCSIYMQPTILNELYKTAKDMGVKYVFIAGDLVEGMYKGAKDKYNLGLFKTGHHDQAKFVAGTFPRVEGITTCFITGEHDLSFLKTKEKVDIGKLISEEREDLIYLGQRRKKVSFVNETNGNEVSIYLQHSMGNVPYTISYKPQQIISSLRNEDKSHILAVGHYCACDSFLRRGVRSFQIPTIVATTPEMRDAHTPVYNTTGAWIVNIKKDKKGKLLNTSQLLIPYYNTIKDDYLTFKPLNLSSNKYVLGNRSRDEFDRIFYNMKNNESLIDFCARMNIDELDFSGILEELKLRDYNVALQEKNGEQIISKKRQYRTNKSVKTPIIELKHLKLALISDTHYCNVKEQPHLVNEVYQNCVKKGINTVLHCGDVTDGDYRNRPDHLYALHQLGFERQLRYVANIIPKIDGIDTYYITGSHDQTHTKNGGADFGKMLSELRPDLHFVGDNKGILNIEKTKVEEFHPGGGCAGSLSYKPQKYIDKMESGMKPNVLVEGHYHQSHFMFYRNVLSFLVPCLTDKTSFAVTQALENTMGAYYVDLYINNKGEVEYLEFEEQRFEAKDVRENDYLKTRQLILK